MLVTSIALSTTLTACSIVPRSPEVVVVAEVPAIEHPEHPGALELQDPKFDDCGSKVCLTKPEARKVVENTVRTGRWASRMNRLVKFYESLLPEKKKKK